jgi:hypothetical protein
MQGLAPRSADFSNAYRPVPQESAGVPVELKLVVVIVVKLFAVFKLSSNTELSGFACLGALGWFQSLGVASPSSFANRTTLEGDRPSSGCVDVEASDVLFATTNCYALAISSKIPRAICSLFFPFILNSLTLSHT